MKVIVFENITAMKISKFPFLEFVDVPPGNYDAGVAEKGGGLIIEVTNPSGEKCGLGRDGWVNSGATLEE